MIKSRREHYLISALLITIFLLVWQTYALIKDDIRFRPIIDNQGTSIHTNYDILK